MRFTACAYAVIFDAAGRVLLCHRADADFWNLPGGGVESGETPWDAVVREVREETGLEVVVERLAGLYSWASRDEMIYSFVCRMTGGVLTESDESDDLGYFPLDALPANIFPEHAARARDAALGRAEALLRVPTGPSARDLVRASREQSS